MDKGAWLDMVHRVAKSWTRLKRLSTCMHTHTHTHTFSPEKHQGGGGVGTEGNNMDFYLRFIQLYAILIFFLEKAMAPHSSTLAWKIPWTEEPGRLQSMGSLRVGHDWATSLSLFTVMHWRRKWQPTPVFLPGESQGWGSLMGCRLWGHTESDTTEAT